MKDFYIKLIISDWMSDPALSMCEPATRGIWLDLLCAMQLNGKPEITGTIEQLSKLSRCSVKDFLKFLDDFKMTKIGEYKKSNAKITLKSRRLERESKSREFNTIRQKRFKEKRKDNAEITPEKQQNNAEYSNTLILYYFMKDMLSSSPPKNNIPKNVILLKKEDGGGDGDIIISSSRFIKWRDMFKDIDIFSEMERVLEIVKNNRQKIGNPEAYIFKLLQSANKEAANGKAQSVQESGNVKFTKAGGIQPVDVGKYK